jgi:hypothetical protein
MSNQELADKIVALLGGCHTNHCKQYIFGNFSASPDRFVRDWRVAGALMEKFSYYELDVALQSMGKPGYKQEAHLKNIDPRAICEACVEALEARESLERGKYL